MKPSESTIIFFNHFHRGDLFTHKEFIRQIKNKVPDLSLQYWHFNHPKCNLDLDIPLTNFPKDLNTTQRFYLGEREMYVNTWIGCYGEIFTRCGGVNLFSLTESWANIFSIINDHLGTKLVINPNKEIYLPRINYDRFNLGSIIEYIRKSRGRKRVLFCNGAPMSNQSFPGNLSGDIHALAANHKNVDFICTEKFPALEENILFTDDIIADKEEYSFRTPWYNGAINNCDVNEISYLSTHCDAIIGKNSGPFVFCETRDNYMDPEKTIVSFSRGAQESMSNGVDMKCKYRLETDHSFKSISRVIKEVVESIDV